MVETRVLEIWNLGNHNKLKIDYNIMLENDNHDMLENDNDNMVESDNLHTTH